MGSRLMNGEFHNEQDDSENSPENSGDSPCSITFNDSKFASTSSPKRRRSAEKIVVYVPIKDVEGSRFKGDMGAPPSDSWAWRKYGQKPIKGSPYPRGYYRCSSAKGCPARKQVERNKSDPTMLKVTYASEHNHPWPAPRNSHQHTKNVVRAAEPTNSEEEEEEEEEMEEDHNQMKKPKIKVASTPQDPRNNPDDQRFANLGEGSLAEYGCNWFSDLECTSSTTMLESALLNNEDRVTDADMAMAFTMRDEDHESFFADLGELPECSAVFRRGLMEREEVHRLHNLAPWCGTSYS